MKTESLLEALRAEIGFEWDEPFIVKMGIVRSLVNKFGFRLNYIRWFFREAAKDGVVSFVTDPSGSEIDETVIVDFPKGMSSEYYALNVGRWKRETLLTGILGLSCEPGIHVNPDGKPFVMKNCRVSYKYYGITYDEWMKLFRQLEKDGFMKVMKEPNESLPDEEVVAVLVRRLPNSYCEENKHCWI